jgi:hypothetical protein
MLGGVAESSFGSTTRIDDRRQTRHHAPTQSRDNDWKRRPGNGDPETAAGNTDSMAQRSLSCFIAAVSTRRFHSPFPLAVSTRRFHSPFPLAV